MTLYGWYSPLAAQLHGSFTYSTPNGQSVQVTLVGPSAEFYYWPDTQAVGKVLEWLGPAEPNRMDAEQQNAMKSEPEPPREAEPVTHQPAWNKAGWSIMTKRGLECALEGIPLLDVVLEPEERTL